MNHTRRHLLQGVTAGATLASLSRFTINDAFAQSANDYKALVCVFMFGGNDGNNLVIPADSNYASYGAVRNAASNIQIAQADLLQFQPKSSSRTFGFHPSIKKLHPLMQSGKLAVLANVGPLNAPMSKADYQANKNRPYQLFSHSDQQAQWQNSNSNDFSRIGWGGRLADTIAPMNGTASMPVITSVAGSVMFGQGNATSMLTVPSGGTFGLTGVTGTDAITTARRDALMALLDEGRDHTLIDQTASGLKTAIELSGSVNPVISTANATVDGLFDLNNNGLAAQLQRVARLIAKRGDFGVKRQVFFVSIGGFDTHANQATTQQNLLAQVDSAIGSFYQSTLALGVADQVTTFTMTDFGRTFKPAAGGGSDHAWGNHHLILGGAVNGGAMYGTFPNLAISGPDDVSSEGRWLPTTSVDQYAATLASWFGVASGDLAKVVPNIGAFATKNLGFV
ncbi:MAG: DUF1501 domain-containing protein [Casimicrobium sp.]